MRRPPLGPGRTADDHAALHTRRSGWIRLQRARHHTRPRLGSSLRRSPARPGRARRARDPQGRAGAPRRRRLQEGAGRGSHRRRAPPHHGIPGRLQRKRSAAAGVSADVLEDIGDPADRILHEAQRCDVVILARETHFQLRDTGTARRYPRPDPARLPTPRRGGAAHAAGTHVAWSSPMAVGARLRARSRRSSCSGWARARRSRS